MSNEVVEDDFDGPAFSLPEIHTPDGRTFHEGIGFLMASEGWTGGPCAFDPASGLQDLPCPQNLLISFAGPGSYEGDGRTTHPNSTFISIAGVPEDRTTVKVKGEWPDHWINSRTARVNFVSQPPNLKGTRLPGANSFIPSPVQSITYGISAADSVPAPGEPIPGDVILVNPDGCPVPTAANPGPSVAPDFAPGRADADVQRRWPLSVALLCAGLCRHRGAEIYPGCKWKLVDRLLYSRNQRGYGSAGDHRTRALAGAFRAWRL